MGDREGLPLGKPVPQPTGAPPSPGAVSGAISSMVNPREALAGGARVLLADVPVEAREARRVLPLGMRPASPPMARFFFASYEETVYSGPYNEAAMIIYASTPLGRGGHVAWMVVDDDTALILGRELLACPKKLAEIGYDDDGESVSARVVRRGTEVLRMEAERSAVEAEPGFVMGERVFNVGGLGQGIFISPIWCLRLGEVIRESWSARGTIRLRHSDYDPLARVVGGTEIELPMRVTTIDINLLRYMLPVGLAGPTWALRTYDMRFR